MNEIRPTEQTTSVKSGHEACNQIELPPDLLKSYPMGRYIELLDQIPEECSYNYFSDEITKIWGQIIDNWGADILEKYNRVTMETLIDLYEPRAVQHRYSDSIVDQFRASLLRIKKAIGLVPYGGDYSHTSDIFHKDLAICRQKVFPAGARLVEKHGAFQRSLLYSGNVVQFMKFLFFYIFVARKNQPYYRIHTHQRDLSAFNPEGWDLCIRRIASMLELHPEVRGMVGGSWFYDPVLEKISPRLLYVRKLPQTHGAWVFRAGPDTSGSALSKSQTRKQLYEEGAYKPMAYVIIWPRKAMIKFSKQYQDIS